MGERECEPSLRGCRIAIARTHGRAHKRKFFFFPLARLSRVKKLENINFSLQPGVGRSESRSRKVFLESGALGVRWGPKAGASGARESWAYGASRVGRKRPGAGPEKWLFPSAPEWRIQVGHTVIIKVAPSAAV